MSYFVRTYKRRKAFLDRLTEGESIASAARAAGGTSGNFKRWREADPDFAKDWDDALEEGTDLLEDVAVQRAIKKSDQLMVVMLKARRPEKFDRASRVELSGSIGVEGAKQKLLNRLSRIKAQGKVSQKSPEKEPAILEQPQAPEPQKLLPAPLGVERGRKRRAASGRG